MSTPADSDSAPRLSFKELLRRSQEGGWDERMPTKDNRISELPPAEVEAHAAGTRPILHEKTAGLLRRFLELKRATGSAVEQALYGSEEMATPAALVSRLLSKRPLVFVGGSDSHVLRDGRSGHGGFERIGTAEEQAPLVLRDYISYDEMALSALLSVSVPTHFINLGHRHNVGRKGRPGAYEPRGVYIAAVGTRFERAQLMESRHMLVTKKHNTAANGYGAEGAGKDALLQLWADFYDLPHFPAWAPDMDRERFLPVNSGLFFGLGAPTEYLDLHVYRRRLRMTLEPLLAEAEARGREAGKSVYFHMVGLGLGVWAVAGKEQDRVLVDVAGEIIQERALPRLATVDFSWIHTDTCRGVTSGQTLADRAGHGVRIVFSNRDPAEPLEDKKQLLVACYAWDSNSYPGNEYWSGSLAGSGDPAAACCSTVPQLQNPDINPNVSGQAAVVYCADEDSGELRGKPLSSGSGSGSGSG